jgi:hypothetical protein
LALDEFRVDHLHRVLHDFDLVHLVEMKNRLAQVNLRDDELNLVPMVSMKALQNQDAKDDQMNQSSLDVKQDDHLRNHLMLVDRMKDVHLMGDQKMTRWMNVDRLMDDQNYLVDLNFRDVLPCAYSLISIEI